MVKRVLVVEDNPNNLALITDVLESLDYEVLQANDGNRGLQMATDELPDLILMDMSLPNKDGWTTAQEIKSNPATQHIPIIAATAHAMAGDRERALEAGCDDYIAKPIDLLDLRRKLNQFLSDG